MSFQAPRSNHRVLSFLKQKKVWIPLAVIGVPFSAVVAFVGLIVVVAVAVPTESESSENIPTPTEVTGYPSNPLVTPGGHDVPRATATPWTPPTPRPTFTPSRPPQEAIDLAVLTIMSYREVLGADIFQDEYGYGLVLMVDWSVNTYQAQQIGEAFLRSFKSFNDDDNPGKFVGSGKYDYRIGVFHPDETPVAEGRKSKMAKGVFW